MTRSWEDEIGRARSRSGQFVYSAIGLVALIALPTFAAEPTKGDFSMASLISFPPPPIDAGTRDMTIAEWETLWTRVLSRSVDDAGRIDFDALTKNHADLDRVVAFVAAVDPMSQPQHFPDRQSRLAFYINAYNAVAMYGVVAAGIPESLGGLTKFTFFYLRTFTIGGKSISLYKFENDVIRPLGEERVHFALNCMVVSCPKLPRTAFDAAALDKELNAAAREFIESPRNVSVDDTKREALVSAIFGFYTQDFLAHAPSLVAYINRYRQERIPSDYAVRVLGYDWTVNSRKWALGR
jgi:hypothetical protein